MSSFRTTKNLLEDHDTYNRYYGDFRGVDFSSDHTQVDDSRLAYMINMYRDYQSGQGQALETIAGFRRRVVLPVDAEVYGIFDFTHKNSDGESVTDILIHAGNYLFKWENYPNSLNIEITENITVPYETASTGVTVIDDDGNEKEVLIYSQTLSDNVDSVLKITTQSGNVIYDSGLDYGDLSDYFYFKNKVLGYATSLVSYGDQILVTYTEGTLTTSNALFSTMNGHKSTAFVMNNKLYIIDGKNYLVYDGSTISDVCKNAYVPTTYINIITSGTNADIGTEYEQRNMLTPQFKSTFVADGETTTFYLNENELDSIDKVVVYDAETTDYTADLENGTITFTTAPSAPEDVGYSEMYAGIEVTASKTYTSVAGTSYSDEVEELLSDGSVSTIPDEVESVAELITNCTIATIFDDRVFLTGNPDYPNHIFYCNRNSTGYVDPSYFGVLSVQQDGVGNVPNTGMIPVSDTLMVLKNDTQQDAMVYFHTATSTSVSLVPKIYPSSQGLNGIGCLGACVNFLDDPIFISRLGVEAMGQLSVRLERAVEHRSSLIDAKLVNADLTNAMVAEWNGYLLVLVDGNMFMADSRQRYKHAIGTMQYEWYYIEGIGVYDGQYTEYLYADELPDELADTTIEYIYTGEDGKVVTENIPLKLATAVYNSELDENEDLTGEVANEPDIDGEESATVYTQVVSVEIDEYSFTCPVYYTVKQNSSGEYEALYCEAKGNYTGGTFRKATTIRSLEENIFFGTENGVICSFNFDMRADDGSIAPKYYSFDDRTIVSGCATKMDCCGIPHLTKNTIRKSTVIKTKSFSSSAAKVKVRTNKKAYEQIARISSSTFSFDDLNFQDLTFNTTEQSLFAVKEKERKWVEKQYYIYSDEYCKPFSLYYISYRYQVIGRYKS